MIKYNNSTINDWNFDDSNIVKVYRNGAVVYYKVTTSGGTPQYDVCYAVVDDITQYQEREFVDVFDNATEKWYKLNNLNQYEEYGIYGDSIATSGTSRLPQGYTEVEYVENTGTSYINTNLQLCSATTNTFTIDAKLKSNRINSDTYQNIFSCMNEEGEPYQGFTYRFMGSDIKPQFIPSNDGSFTQVTNEDGTISVTASSTNGLSYSHTYPLSICCGLNSSRNPFRFTNTKVYTFKVTLNDELVAEYIPTKRDSDSKYGLYDLVTDTFYISPNGNNFSGGEPITPTAATYYQGKLAIVDGYEFMYSGSSWVNVGEVSGSTATLPNVPFSVNYNAKNYDASTQTLIKTSGQLVDVDAVITVGTPTVNDGYLTIANYAYIRATISGYQTYFNRDNYNPNLTIVSKQRTDGINGHMFANRDSSYNWMYRCYSNKLTLHGSSETGSLAVTTQPVIESVRVDSNRIITYNNYTDNTTSSTSSFSYGSTNGGSFAMFQGNANATGEYFVGDFYWVYMSQNTLTDEQIQEVIDYNEGGGGQSVYPLYYDEKSDPLNNLSFSSMTEATEYAYNNCVYDGMKATIDGDLYEFDSESGWTEVQYYYRVEDVTASSQGGSGWTVTSSSANNPNPSYYDDYSTAPNSTSYQYKVAKVTIFGYDSFTYYLRSSGYSGAYLVSTNIDEIQTQPTGITYSSSSAITNTYNFNKAAGSQVNLGNYRRVTYNNLDKTVEHTFYVLFYNGYTGSTSYVNNTYGTLLIPKDQSQENWEQVTFSASTNISGDTKNLYIDGNNSSSGGTNNFFSRWMVGLPSGSHSSYTNYSSYYYCPSVTSATFTSVDGGVRQIDYSYNSISSKTLQFRLVDESGSTITTANTVYYNVIKYNECGSGQNNQNLSFPLSQSVANGGSFVFTSSSNRHYIYGYQPNIALNTSYYCDNYSTYFDIPYTKLNTEAVTITYTTYDPNDSETPTFSTDISWPYGNSGTSSTTLVSYEVPYTYDYSVRESSGLFYTSANTQTFTASQSSRAVTFMLYPNNREFSTVADMEAYAYAWEGMKASVGSTKYEYENGEWNELQYEVLDYLIRDSAHSGYIEDIGVVLKDNTKFQIKLKPTNGGGNYLLGQSNATSDNNDYRMFWASSTLYYDYGSQRISKSVQLNSVYEYEVGNYYIKNLTTSSNVMSSTTQSGTATSMSRIIGLFPNNNANDFAWIYYLKVYEGETLVKNFIPIRNADSIVTLLDTISGTECIVNGSLMGSDE